MTIGLVLLAITAVLIFFGVSERFFRRIGVPNWLAFLFVLALVVGVIVPDIGGGRFSLNVGGFIVPLIIMIVLEAVMGAGGEMGRSFISMIAVASVAVATRMLIEPQTGGMILAASLIVGLVGGAVAYLVAQTRLAVIASVMGGIVLGDVITNFIYRYVLEYNFALGTDGVFDSLIIGSIFGILLLEAVEAIRRLSAQKRTSAAALSTESAQDVTEEEKEHSAEEFFDDFI